MKRFKVRIGEMVREIVAESMKMAAERVSGRELVEVEGGNFGDVRFFSGDYSGRLVEVRRCGEKG